MRSFVIIHETGEIEHQEIDINPTPRVVSQYIKRERKENHTPKAIITTLHSQTVLWERGKHYFDLYGGDAQMTAIMQDFAANLDGDEFAKLYEHITGCEASYVNDGDAFGYNIGG